MFQMYHKDMFYSELRKIISAADVSNKQDIIYFGTQAFLIEYK